MPAPTCPVHGYELELHQVTQGDLVLGYMFLCPLDEWGSIGGECTTCVDADMQGNPIFEEWKQLELAEVSKCKMKIMSQDHSGARGVNGS